MKDKDESLTIRRYRLIVGAACKEDVNLASPMTKTEKAIYDEIVAETKKARKEGRFIEWIIPYDYD